MNNYINLLNKNNLSIKKITIKGNSIIILTGDKKYVIRRYKDITIYDYLLSKGFDHFPKIIDYDSDYLLTEYIEEIEYGIDEKANDFFKLLSILHNKTSYYITTSLDEYKEIYERIKNNLDDLNNYYNNMFDMFLNIEYPSPSLYLLERNISIFFSAINYLYYKLDKWYSNNKENTKKRVCTLYNDIDLDKLLKSKDKTYFSSFNNTSIDSPVIDLYNFYKKYGDLFPFESLLLNYEKVFPLLEEEKELLLILICIPDKVIITNNINNISIIKRSINKAYYLANLLNSKEEEGRETHETKDN